jgi:uncharacterized protein YggE
MRRILFAALLAMSALASLNSTAIAQGTRTIDVTGHGDSSAKPDLMTLSFVVTSHSESADDCTRNEAEVSARLVDALKAKIGDSGKITTSDFSFNPSVEYGNATPTPIFGTPEPPPATWEFKADVNVYTESIEPLGDLIDAGLAAGATTVSQAGRSQMPEELQENSPETSGAASGTASSLSGGGGWRRSPPAYFVGLSVVSDGVSPSDCVRKGTALMSRVEAALKKQMSGQGKVMVSDFSVEQLNPQQRAAIQQYQPPPPPQPERKVYDAQVNVTAETTKLELLGPIVEAATKAGAARLNQVSFSLKDDSAARKEAIEKASADAKSKAETLASSMGVKLKGILRISTNAQVRPYVVYGNQYMAAASMSLHREAVAALEAAQMPVTPRDVGFGADVNVTYQIE